MYVQTADGSLWPDVSREEFFRLENPNLPGVIWLRDVGLAGTDVELSTAPDAGGEPGAFTLRATVTLPAGALKMETLPTDDVYIKITPLTSKVEFSVASASRFHYSRHLPDAP